MADLHNLAEAALAEQRRNYGDDRWFDDHYVDISSDEAASVAFINACSPQVVMKLMEELAILKASNIIESKYGVLALALEHIEDARQCGGKLNTSEEYQRGWDEAMIEAKGRVAMLALRPSIPAEVAIFKTTHMIPVNAEMIADAIEFEEEMRNPSYGPPRPRKEPHESHLLDDDAECLLCGEWDDWKLAEECPYEVVPRS